MWLMQGATKKGAEGQKMSTHGGRDDSSEGAVLHESTPAMANVEKIGKELSQDGGHMQF